MTRSKAPAGQPAISCAKPTGSSRLSRPSSAARARLRSWVRAEGSRPTQRPTRGAISQSRRPEPQPISSTRLSVSSQGRARASTRSRYSSTSAAVNGSPVKLLMKPPAVTRSTARSATRSNTARTLPASTGSGAGSGVSTSRQTTSDNDRSRQRISSTAPRWAERVRTAAASLPARIASTRSAGHAGSSGR